MNSTKQTDPLSALVHEAVRAAIAEQLPLIVAALKPAAPSTGEAQAEGRVFMAELCTRLRLNRTTVLRKERAEKIPRRRKFPDGKSGWLRSEIDAWLAQAPVDDGDPEKNAARAARIGRH